MVLVTTIEVRDRGLVGLVPLLSNLELGTSNVELYSTVTLFARLRGWSTSAPRRTAT